jgi:hypothetical protein
MTKIATNRLSCLRAALLFVSSLLIASCTQGSYEPMFTSRSPDGAFVARLERLEEGTLGSTRYRLLVSRADGTEPTDAFRGENGWVSEPVWQSSSTLLVPFCFGTASSLKSVLPFHGSQVVHFKTSSSAYIRVHLFTAPRTTVEGTQFCLN